MIEERILLFEGQVGAYNVIEESIPSHALLQSIGVESELMEECDSLEVNINSKAEILARKHYDPIKNGRVCIPKGTIYIQFQPPFDLVIAQSAAVEFRNGSSMQKKIRMWCVLNFDRENQIASI